MGENARPTSIAMGAAASAPVSLPDDAVCEAVLRKFIAEDLERLERLLRRAGEQLVSNAFLVDTFRMTNRTVKIIQVYHPWEDLLDLVTDH